ncbi:hypothetical protein FRC01_001231 [Tulasnella sp. 417]|nr:hypothetical protein FRC01_001231 [Tulasnella sp. 417]
MNVPDASALIQELLDTAAFEIPDPPDLFGQDGGKFYRYYDAFANEIDEDKVKGLKEQLDGMLIFAGLFAGINTAFLTLTLSYLSQNPADITNALLTQNNALLTQLVTGQNDTILPLDAFRIPFDVPTLVVVLVALLSMSLTTALVVSFIAVLGRQWLIYYRKRSGGGPDRQRWDQLQRFLGAKRWNLDRILDDILPSVLQVGLFLFCTALILFLKLVNRTVAIITMIPILVGLGFFASSVAAAAADKFCPFQSPISHFAFAFFHWFARLASSLIANGKFLGNGFINIIKQPRPSCNSLLDAVRHIKFVVPRIVPPSEWKWLSYLLGPREKPVPTLQIIALERVVRKSEDPACLLYAVAQIPCITDLEQLERLWKDDAFRGTLLELYENSYSRNLQLKTKGHVDRALAARRLYTVAITHFLLYLDCSRPEIDRIFSSLSLHEGEGFKQLCPWNVEYVPGESQIFVQTSLSLSIMGIIMVQPTAQDLEKFCKYLSSCSKALTMPNWRLLCLICWIVAQLPRIQRLQYADLKSMARAFRGEIDSAPATIETAFEVLSEWRHTYHFDHEEFFKNLLRFCSQVVAHSSQHPKLQIDQRLSLLHALEKTLRSKACSDELKDLVGRMRENVVANFRTECFRDGLAVISEGVFKALISLFDGLLPPVGQAPPSPGEDAEVARVLGPLVREITSNNTTFHWDEKDWNTTNAPPNLRDMIDKLDQIFSAFDLGGEQEAQHYARVAPAPEGAEGFFVINIRSSAVN